MRAVFALAVLSAALYGWLAGLGDLRSHLPVYLAVHAVLLGLMLAAWRCVRGGGGRAERLVLGAALGFRLIAAAGEPALSDDVNRYVWDGRAQVQGIHPYRYAPDDPALQDLRDEGWKRINHPQLKTAYPPLAQMLFAFLAALRAGPRGFKLAMGLLDFGVVLALAFHLRRRSLPRERLLLYAWNPLAVMEAAGSGHCEPLGMVLLLFSMALFLRGRGRTLSTLAMAGAAHAKILPVVLLPGYVRRVGWRQALVLILALASLAVPYSLWGPAMGSGLLDYATRWEGNAFLFAGVRAAAEALDTGRFLQGVLAGLRAAMGDRLVPWDWLVRHVWPGDIARLLVGLAAVGWAIAVGWLARPEDMAEESCLVLGGVLLLSPTLHPWYLLWVLPFAAVFLSRGFLLLAALAPLSYLGGAGDVPWSVRLVEFVPPLACLLWDGLRRPFVC